METLLFVLLVVVVMALAVVSYLFWQSCDQVRSLTTELAEVRLKHVRDIKERDYKQALDFQNNTGYRIFNALKPAVDQNPNLRIDMIVSNGTDFTIIVGWPDARSMTYGGPGYGGYPILQVDVQFTRPDEPKRIHVLECPYGPDSYAEATEAGIKGVIDEWAGKLATFSIYKSA